MRCVCQGACLADFAVFTDRAVQVPVLMPRGLLLLPVTPLLKIAFPPWEPGANLSSCMLTPAQKKVFVVKHNADSLSALIAQIDIPVRTCASCPPPRSGPAGRGWAAGCRCDEQLKPKLVVLHMKHHSANIIKCGCTGHLLNAYL